MLKNITTGQWVQKFNMEKNLWDGCAVKISDNEVVTIAGPGESQRYMYLYNVKTGAFTKYGKNAPTQVSHNVQPKHWSIIQLTHFFLYSRD